MPNLDNLKYSKEHEWVLLDGDTATIGITEHASNSLGDIVYVDLPEVGDSVTQFEKFGEVESVKAVSDLFSPISGEVVAVNDTLSDEPGNVNQAPYEAGWLVKVKLADTSELDQLMDINAYTELTKE